MTSSDLQLALTLRWRPYIVPGFQLQCLSYRLFLGENIVFHCKDVSFCVLAIFSQQPDTLRLSDRIRVNLELSLSVWREKLNLEGVVCGEAHPRLGHGASAAGQIYKYLGRTQQRRGNCILSAPLTHPQQTDCWIEHFGFGPVSENSVWQRQTNHSA